MTKAKSSKSPMPRDSSSIVTGDASSHPSPENLSLQRRRLKRWHQDPSGHKQGRLTELQGGQYGGTSVQVAEELARRELAEFERKFGSRGS